MQGSSTSYAYSGETTEWEDILIKKGITTRTEVLLNKGLDPHDFDKEEEVVQEDEGVDLEDLTLDELKELEEDDEFSDTRMLEEYRNRRLKELQQKAVLNRHGEVLEIVKDDWVREVTEGSNSCAVVIHLYENSMVECQLVDEALSRLAPRFKYIKFLKIKYNQAIENWPERNLPTVFVYEKGALKTQLITLNSVGGKTMKAQDLEWFLAKNGVITDSELDEDPREEDRKQVKKTNVYGSRRTGQDSDDEDNDD